MTFNWSITQKSAPLIPTVSTNAFHSVIAFDEGERILVVSFFPEINPADIDYDVIRFQGLDAILDWLAGSDGLDSVIVNRGEWL